MIHCHLKAIFEEKETPHINIRYLFYNSQFLLLSPEFAHLILQQYSRSMQPFWIKSIEKIYFWMDPLRDYLNFSLLGTFRGERVFLFFFVLVFKRMYLEFDRCENRRLLLGFDWDEDWFFTCKDIEFELFIPFRIFSIFLNTWFPNLPSTINNHRNFFTHFLSNNPNHLDIQIAFLHNTKCIQDFYLLLFFQ